MSDTTMKSAEECVVCLVKLIGRVQSTDVHEVILNCCVCLIQSDERYVNAFIYIPRGSQCWVAIVIWCLNSLIKAAYGRIEW